MKKEVSLQRAGPSTPCAVKCHGVSYVIHVDYSLPNIFLSCEDKASELLPLYPHKIPRARPKGYMEKLPI